MRHRFRTAQWVPYPVEQVFALFADPANLPPLMPRWQHARIRKATLVRPSEASADKVAAGKGSLISITFRPVPLLPVRLRWDAYIDSFAWNEFFCDQQRRGPFRHFRHCHRILPETRQSISGAVVCDEVEYELPLWFLGDVANWLTVRRQIGALFAHRQKALLALLAQQSRKQPPLT